MRDQVTEPHVGEFMKNGVRSFFALLPIACLTLNVTLLEGNGGCILHSADVEFRHDQLIVFLEWVPDIEIVLVEGHAVLRNLEPFFNGDELCE